MHTRDATITFNKGELVRAITAHLACAILAQSNTSEQLELVGTSVDAQLDGTPVDFSILHVLTDDTSVTAMVLTRSVFEGEEEAFGPSTLEYVLILVEDTEFKPIQSIFSMDEKEAVQNKNRTLRELMELLFA